MHFIKWYFINFEMILNSQGNVDYVVIAMGCQDHFKL